MNKDLLEAYRKYVIDEFDQDIVEEDIKTTGLLGLAYTTYGDNDEIDIQISYDILNEKIKVDLSGARGYLTLEENYAVVDMINTISGITFQDWYSEYVDLYELAMVWI